MRRLLLMLAIILVFVACQPAQAATFRASDNAIVPSGTTINDDLYITGGTVAIDGRINGDLLVSGGTVTINGPVRDDLMVGGGNVILNGQIGQSVRAGAGTLSVSGRIGQDLVVGAGNVSVSRNATIGRDVLIGSGTATLSGNIGRNLWAGSGDITIDGPIGGNARVDVGDGTLTLTNRANIEGDLTYSSSKTAEIADGATIGGETTHRRIEPARTASRTGSRIIGFILSYLAALLFGILLLLLFPRKTAQIAEAVFSSPWISLLLGLAVLIVTPVVAIILMILVITLPIGLTLLFLYILGIYLAKIFVGLAVGRAITGYFKLGGGNYVALLIGLLLVMLLGLIPIVGPFLRFLYVVFGLGAAVYVLYRAFTENRAAQP